MHPSTQVASCMFQMKQAEKINNKLQVKNTLGISRKKSIPNHGRLQKFQNALSPHALIIPNAVTPPPLRNFRSFIKPFGITLLTQCNTSMIKQTGIFMLFPLLLNILLYIKMSANSLFRLLIDCRARELLLLFHSIM